ncbi:hypothetical protein BOX15_Mlig025937g1 [Macrostomum lignano]|uniref:TLC domain-containing protein n=1 Tax=Macrostomum lignano TaxID=282301 RepID=A0A267F571_9PLAT|nr:hypothetical protein BOX15_Mlig025937g1 [Macrostomum lignano]
MWQDLINHISPFTYYMVAISTGYFFYDFMDLLIQGKLLKEWELSLHHIAVISKFVYNLSNRMFIGYTAVALLTEVNSIFLHLRKLMQMLRVSFTAPVYRLNALINLATFLLCRGYCLARITYGIVAERSRIDTAYLCLLGGAMCIMNLINPALFVILLRSDVFRRSRRLSNTVGHGSDPGPTKLMMVKTMGSSISSSSDGSCAFCSDSIRTSKTGSVARPMEQKSFKGEPDF